MTLVLKKNKSTTSGHLKIRVITIKALRKYKKVCVLRVFD